MRLLHRHKRLLVQRTVFRAVLALLVILATPAAFAVDGAAHTTYFKVDILGRVVAEVGPDPDGAGPLPYTATRYTYDPDGNLASTEIGVASGVSDADVLGMVPLAKTEASYDGAGRILKEVVSGRTSGASAWVVTPVTQHSYDSVGRLLCSVVRMNPAVFSNPPSDACSHSAVGSYGQDRIERKTYDAAGRLLKIQKGYGTSVQQDYVTYTYTANGLHESIYDAKGNKSLLTYDGFDRPSRLYFPSPTSVGQHNGSDYEQYGYDSNDNRTSLKKRDGQTLYFGYDALNRMTVKDVPTGDDIFFGYDLRGQKTSARFGSTAGSGIIQTYDGAQRATSTTTFGRSIDRQYDANGNRTRLTWPDGSYVNYTFDALNRLSGISEGASGASLATISYNPLSQRVGLNYGPSGIGTSLSYDATSRLTELGHNLNGSVGDVSFSFARNPSGQVSSKTSSNDIYAYSNHINNTVGYTTNGLNQYTQVGSASFAYDANGNLTNDGQSTYSYDSENRLTGVSGAKNGTLSYDPLGRIRTYTSGANSIDFVYDGDMLIAEYSGGTVARRYVQGSEEDEPLVWYEGTSRRLLYGDQIGSVIAVSDPAGNALSANTYDVYGIPSATNLGRFGFTGQIFLPELALWHYKARMYSPTLGRFLQTDPIGYEDDFNLYAYVGNDPLNKTDPTGMFESHWLLRALVPGQVTYDNAMTAAENGNYGRAATLAGAMVGEQVLTAVSVGTAGAAAQTTRAVASAEGKALSLKYKPGWSSSQRAAADEKVAQLEAAGKRGELKVSIPERSGTSARKRFKADGGEVSKGQDVDHVQDLQLGGKDVTGNMQALDSSVNRSLGSQVNQQIKDLPKGTQICGVKICD